MCRTRALVAFLVSLASACALPASVRLETSEGIVLARDVEHAEAAASVMREFSPQVREIVEMDRQRPTVKVMLTPWLDEDARTTEHAIWMNTTELPGADTLLIHELVHWYAQGFWKTLPCVVEEGFAYLLSCMLNVDTPLSFPAPESDARLRAVFEMERDEYAGLSHTEVTPIALAGLWVCGTIGIDSLKSLARRAHDQGLTRVPDEWIMELLPESRQPINLLPHAFATAPRSGKGESSAPLLGSANGESSGKGPVRTWTLSNGSRAEVRVKVEFFDVLGRPIGWPQAGTIPAGGTTTIPAPPGAVAHSVTIVDCDPPAGSQRH